MDLHTVEMFIVVRPISIPDVPLLEEIDAVCSGSKDQKEHPDCSQQLVQKPVSSPVLPSPQPAAMPKPTDTAMLHPADAAMLQPADAAAAFEVVLPQPTAAF